MRKRSPATEVRHLKREIKELSARNAKLERRSNWGQVMANICFNLSQNASIPENYRKSMKDCQKGWDEA